VSIQKRNLEWDSQKPHSLRSEARFKQAKCVLSAVRKEFSQIGIPERKYRDYINDEIESASNSLQLSEFQRRLLEVEFFFQKKNKRAIHAFAHANRGRECQSVRIEVLKLLAMEYHSTLTDVYEKTGAHSTCL